MSESADQVLTGVEGQVKWFDPKKGFGFIVGPQGQDVFVHYTQIDGDGFRVLKDGATVRYDAALSDKGWHATRVERVEQIEVKARQPGTHTNSPRR
ncbi:MAG TPA: hypothetical protein DEB06_11625 [Phycisphaerales bacterium]|nr:hypothetical protein [Phycisphaerales bacterium]